MGPSWSHPEDVSMMKSNFSFLQDRFPVLEKFGSLTERYCYSDANSCLMKLGMIGETIVNLIFSYDRIPLPRDNTAVARIDTLLREGLISRELSDVLHALRKARNKAAHENYGSAAEGKTLLPMAYGLCEWFMGVYGDCNYQNQPFQMPQPEEESARSDKAAEEKEAAILMEKAAKTAAAAEKISPEKRRQQAQKAAGRRVISEAETRYLIDEQLRSVGWEVNAENLRHARPEKEPQPCHCRMAYGA